MGDVVDARNQRESSAGSQFDCHICLCTASDPVVTLCGHLYCWGCLYTWLCRQQTCPACKDYCDEDRVIPVYCRDAQSHKNEQHAQYKGLPPRPAALRLLMPTLPATAGAEAAHRNQVPGHRRAFSLIPPALRQGSWLRNLSVQHQVVLKQLLFFLGSVLILLLLLW